ncbi:stalk domain-containing protein [Ammoniphilus sp. 3BR4]|uniref:stalk domain-containing protein n=1 Tax=Ammoniphilus sp. 3BR4 TaxID=3158265 RepID=UPI003467B239
MQALFQRSFWAFLLVLSFVFSVLPLAPVNAASSAVKVVKDGKALSFDVPPQIIKGRTMVPYRVIAESLGGKVDWNATTRTVSVVKGGTTVKLTVGSTAAFTNNTKVTLDSAPVIVKGRTLVPVRFLSETLGLWVSWDGATNTVKIDSKVSIQTTLGAVTLNKVPQRVVVLDMYLLDIITSLGIKPIGVAQEDPTNKSLPAYLDRQINHPFTWVGDRKQPSTEVIASLKPDLIIGDVNGIKKLFRF